VAQSDMLELMVAFRTAYAAGDRDGLLAVTAADFEWHQHYARSAEDLPTGRVLQGIDALLAELSWRQAHWHNVRYADLQERSAGDLLVQTFSISGVEGSSADAGTPFQARAVDLYPVIDGRITRKDTYWKYQQ